MDEIIFNEEHKRTLKKTPFWLLFESIIDKHVDKKWCRKSDNMILEIILCFNPNTSRFCIGAEEVKIRRNDVSLIFGIQDGFEKIDSTLNGKVLTPFVERRFKNDRRLTAPIIKSRLIQASRGTTENDFEDVSRLLCLYLLVTVFFLTTGHTLSWGYIPYIEDLDEIRKYNWSQLILNALISSLSKKRETPDTVTGCVIVIPVSVLNQSRMFNLMSYKHHTFV